VHAWKPFLVAAVGLFALGCLMAQAMAFQDETERRRRLEPDAPTWKLSRPLRWLTLPSFGCLGVLILTTAYGLSD
jgi:hypothetical protein